MSNIGKVKIAKTECMGNEIVYVKINPKNFDRTDCFNCSFFNYCSVLMTLHGSKINYLNL